MYFTKDLSQIPPDGGCILYEGLPLCGLLKGCNTNFVLFRSKAKVLKTTKENVPFVGSANRDFDSGLAIYISPTRTDVSTSLATTG
jgi:hypothetical protein